MSGSPTPNPPPPQWGVNSQILDAVRQSTEFALGFADLGAPTATTGTVSAGATIAYDKAIQAAAFAAQDATDFQRNILALSTAVQGKAMELALGGDEEALIPWAMALASSFVAPIVTGMAAKSVVDAVTTPPFPRS